MLMNFNPLDFSNGLNLKSLNILLNAAVSNTYILVTMIYSWKEKKKKEAEDSENKTSENQSVL